MLIFIILIVLFIIWKLRKLIYKLFKFIIAVYIVGFLITCIIFVGIYLIALN